MPSLRFSFRDHLSFVGWRKYRTGCDCQFAQHISPHTSPFQLVFEPSKCPSASTETGVRSKKTSVRSKKKKKQKNSKKNVQRRTERRRQQQRGGKFQRASLMFFLLEDKLPLWLSYIDKPIKQQLLQKQTRGAFLCICRFGDWNFSYTATLATKTFRLLPSWRVLLKRFFEPWFSYPVMFFVCW